jgi:ZIP family zinc transporter
MEFNMIYEVIKGLSLPFVGTLVGVLCVIFVKKEAGKKIQSTLCGFAAGVMTAASVWSLLLPSLDYTRDFGIFCFLPAVIGFMAGTFFVLILDKLTEKLVFKEKTAKNYSEIKQSMILMIAVSVHNLPEGMAVGIVYAEFLAGRAGVSAASALALAAGIALQNFPEGAIVSMPMKALGMSRIKAFAFGVISAAVELLGAVLSLVAAGMLVGMMPYMLAFAAGAMMYAVASELLPEVKRQRQNSPGVLAFAVGFCVMMSLDTVFS